MKMLMPNTNDEFDYAECFNPGEGKESLAKHGTQKFGSLLSPNIDKWSSRDCPLCFEPFVVVRHKRQWHCTNCHRIIKY
jgi:ribosomal protein S27AE